MIPLRDTQQSNSTPYVAIAIIFVNVLCFFFEISLDEFSRNELIRVFGIVPAYPSIVPLFTHMFLHGGWAHLLGNMWFLWIFADNIEDVLGHARFFFFYLAAGLAAGLFQLFLNAGSHVPIIGASGAIAGVMGAYLAKFPHSRIVTLVPVLFIFTMEIPAYVMLIYWFLLQFISGVGEIGYSQAARGGGGVAWFAHVGGFIFGYVAIKILPTRERYLNRYDLRW